MYVAGDAKSGGKDYDGVPGSAYCPPPGGSRCEELWLRSVALRHAVDEPRVDFSARLTRVMIETNAPDGRERLRGALTRHCSWSGWRPAPPCSNASR